MNIQIRNQQFNIGDRINDAEARPQARHSIIIRDLHMILESIRAEHENYEFGCWRLGPDDDAMGDTYWIARENFETGWTPAVEENDDESPSLPGYGRPSCGARILTGHPLRSAADAPPVRLGRQDVEIVALANDILRASSPRYDCLPRRERQAAIVAAVSEAVDRLTREREAALDRLADTIGFREFGRGTRENRRHQLDWLLDGMSAKVIFCRFCGAGFCAGEPLDPHHVRDLERYRLGSNHLSPCFSAHEVCRAVHKKEPAS